MSQNGMKSPTPAYLRVFWLCIGVLALILGGIGALLPVLPTTPFVLLAAFAFGKSSPALRNRLLDNKIFGPMIRDWEANGTIARRYKMIACLVMGLTLTFSLLAGLRFWIVAVQAVCMGAAAAYVITRPETK